MRKKDFVNYINSLPNSKTEAIEKIAAGTCSTKVTVYRWLNGGNIPKIKRRAIANILGIAESELFPTSTKTTKK